MNSKQRSAVTHVGWVVAFGPLSVQNPSGGVRELMCLVLAVATQHLLLLPGVSVLQRPANGPTFMGKRDLFFF